MAKTWDIEYLNLRTREWTPLVNYQGPRSSVEKFLRANHAAVLMPGREWRVLPGPDKPKIRSVKSTILL